MTISVAMLWPTRHILRKYRSASAAVMSYIRIIGSLSCSKEWVVDSIAPFLPSCVGVRNSSL